MKKIFLYCSLFIFHYQLFSQNPVLLQPWVEVYGTTGDTSLGSQVTGFIPKTNFNYRAGVTQVNKTGLYKLQNQSDKNPYGFVLGENIKQADLNGDGYVDLIFRKPGEYYVTPDTIEIYWGTSNGLDSINTTKIIGEDRKDAFGSSLCVGNIVGDSLPDLVITAPFYSSTTVTGKCYIYKGSPQFSTTPYITFLGDSIAYYLGYNCAIGDINNDSFNDLIIRGYYQPASGVGRYSYLNIYWGSLSFDTIRDVRIIGKDYSLKGLTCFDVNGDGIDDLLWTNRDSAECIYVHYGNNNFSTTPNLRLKDPGVANFGNEIANAEDMNGDGNNDIAVGANLGSITNGYVFIYGGGPKINDLYDASYTKSTDGGFGTSISSVGDINGDGLSDIIVGAPYYPFNQNRGYWGIFLGSSNIKVTSARNEESQHPKDFKLFQNYPNPFNGQTIISFQLEKEANVTIKITNSLGQEVLTMVEGEKQAGIHQRMFDAKNLSSGWYVCTLTVIQKNNSQSYSQSRAMILEK